MTTGQKRFLSLSKGGNPWARSPELPRDRDPMSRLIDLVFLLVQGADPDDPVSKVPSEIEVRFVPRNEFRPG